MAKLRVFIDDSHVDYRIDGQDLFNIDHPVLKNDKCPVSFKDMKLHFDYAILDE